MGRNVPARGRTKRKMTALPMPREGGRLKAARAEGGVVSVRGESNWGFSKGGDSKFADSTRIGRIPIRVNRV